MRTARTIIKTTACTAFVLALTTMASAKTLTSTVTASSADEPIAVEENKKPKMQPGARTVSAKVTAAYEVDGTVSRKKVVLKNKKLSTTQQNESVIGAFNKAQVELGNCFLDKSGDTSNQDASAFFGVNAALVATSGSSVTAKNLSITTNAEGANAIFATGKNSKVSASNVKIRTASNSSRGLDATEGGMVEASNVDIETQGEHCAAFATDRGGGTISVVNGKAKTSGEGSPVLYSTGKITANNINGISDSSEIGVIEGKNSLVIDGGNYSNTGKNAFMLYQSTSGDAEEGTATFSAKNAMFNTEGSGAFFYITNTDAEASLSNCSISSQSDVLVNASGNNSERGWGRKGSNGATFRISIDSMRVDGDILCDKISSVSLTLGSKAIFTGAIDSANSGTVSVSMKNNAQWILTGDSYVSSLSDSKNNYSNIKSNGYTIFYDKTNKANSALNGKTIKLRDGGLIKPFESTTKTTKTKQRDSSNGHFDVDDQFDDDDRQFGDNDRQFGDNDRQFDDDNNQFDDDNNQFDDNRPQPPEMTQLYGTVKVSGKGSRQVVEFVTREGKRYTLAVMKMKDKPDTKKQRVDGAQSDGRSNVQSKDNRQEPKVVTLDDLIKLNGSQVTLYGVFTDNDKNIFTVIKYEEELPK